MRPLPAGMLEYASKDSLIPLLLLQNFQQHHPDHLPEAVARSNQNVLKVLKKNNFKPVGYLHGI